MILTKVVCTTVLLIASGSCFAQDSKEIPKFFHLDIVTKELEEGKLLSSRKYSTIVSTGKTFNNQSIRTGSKIAIPKGSGGEITYIDVGVSFDFVFPMMMGDDLAMGLSADVSSIAPVSVEAEGSRTPPVIRQNKWTAPIVLALRTPTTVFSSDDVSSKRKLQVEVTATPIAP